MKVKTLRYSVVKCLVVADPEINEKFGGTAKNPVQLASIVNPFHSGVYEVLDWRLSQHRKPSPYLEGGTLAHYLPTTPEIKEYLLSKLHTYREEKDGTLVWDSFDLAHFEGDNPSCTSKHGTQETITARFTQKAAQELFSEIREFWERWSDPELTKARIVNPYRQISESEIRSYQIIQEMGLEKQALKKVLLDSFDKKYKNKK